MKHVPKMASLLMFSDFNKPQADLISESESWDRSLLFETAVGSSMLGKVYEPPSITKDSSGMFFFAFGVRFLIELVSCVYFKFQHPISKVNVYCSRYNERLNERQW